MTQALKRQIEQLTAYSPQGVAPGRGGVIMVPAKKGEYINRKEALRLIDAFARSAGGIPVHLGEDVGSLIGRLGE